MTVKRALIAAIVGQFGHPRGTAGSIAGWVMAHRPSNRQRNRWVVSLLDVQPTDRVLEIGFGPGLAIAGLSRRVGDSGHVYGIDHSEVMLRQATRRNAAAIAAGRVSLSRAPVDQPRIPSTAEIAASLRVALKAIPAQRLWVNPDCGLKTRQMDEVTASLRNLVAAAAQVRAESS
jgi:SAM-dependent methyltransferase